MTEPGTILDAGAVAELDAKVAGLIAAERPFDEAIFAELALEMFAYQFAACEPYRRYCLDLGATPMTVEHWTAIPPIPSLAFKEAPITCADPATAEVVYKTSGTRSGGARSGVVYRDRLADELCRLAQLRAHKDFMLPDRERIAFVSLAPTPEAFPHAGVAHCMRLLAERHGNQFSASFFGERGPDFEALADRLDLAEQQGEPLAIYGATFTFVILVDWLAERGKTFRLPPGSRINHGSGYKGRSRELTPEAFLASIEAALGIRPDFTVNVLGLTELGSQFYDNVLRNRVLGRNAPRYKEMHAWTRTKVLDPVTLGDAPFGEVGLLAHYDLSLRGNVLAVLTEDLGYLVGDGFEIVGRAAEAELRGCNLAIEELIGSTN